MTESDGRTRLLKLATLVAILSLAFCLTFIYTGWLDTDVQLTEISPAGLLPVAVSHKNNTQNNTCLQASSCVRNRTGSVGITQVTPTQYTAFPHNSSSTSVKKLLQNMAHHLRNTTPSMHTEVQSPSSTLHTTTAQPAHPHHPAPRPQPNVLNYPYHHRPHLADTRHTCTSLAFSPVRLPTTALASYPGSGNTWTRHLIELITGIYSGAVYDDLSLKKAFPGEGRIDDRVVVIKTHCPWWIGCIRSMKRAVLIIRHPHDAIKSAKTYLVTQGHKQTLTNIDPAQWRQFYPKQLAKWRTFHQYWFYQAHGMLDMFVLFYKDLQTNLEQTLVNLAHFLGKETLTRDNLDCILGHFEGSYHRKENHVFDHLDFFDNQTNVVVTQINKLIGNCVARKWCVTSYSTTVEM